MIKVYYEYSWFGYDILSKDMHPLSNMHVSVPDRDIDKFKAKVKKRFGNDDIEFIEGLDNYYKDKQ